MPNRFIFSLRFSTKVFWRLGALALTFAFFMTLFRANLYFLSIFHAFPDADPIEIVYAFVAGLRFDLLVFGFIMIPVYLSLMVQALAMKWPRWLLTGFKFYFGAIWLVICLLSCADFFFFARHGRRMRFADYRQWTFEDFFEQTKALQANQTLVFLTITILLLILGYMLIRGLKFGEWKDEYSPQPGSQLEIFWRVLFPVFLVALAARGTLEPHHLEYSHSLISNNTVINEMALNAVWCFDK